MPNEMLEPPGPTGSGFVPSQTILKVAPPSNDS